MVVAVWKSLTYALLVKILNRCVLRKLDLLKTVKSSRTV
jgi:hypothetical protein